MEKFLIPKDKSSFVSWLLQLSIDNDWTIVVEYSNEDTYNYLINHTTITSLPATIRHEYHPDCKMTAFSNVTVTNDFVNDLIHKSHVLSIYDRDELIFLIADDFHEECFSCTTSFFKGYYKILSDQNLINVNWRKKDSC